MCGCGRGTRGRGLGVIVCCRCISSISRVRLRFLTAHEGIDRDHARNQNRFCVRFRANLARRRGHEPRVTRSRRRVGATRAFEFSDENGSCGDASTARGIRTPARAPRRCRTWIRGCGKFDWNNRAYSSSLIVALAATALGDGSDSPASVLACVSRL